MGIGTMRMWREREEIVKQKVVSEYDVPLLDFNGGTNMEVTGDQRVYLNGVLLGGVRLAWYDHKRLDGEDGVPVRLWFPCGIGEVYFKVNNLIVTAGTLPTCAKLVDPAPKKE